ncbi:hypothetical protein C5167_014966 [Papaver somniferum]|uniref:Uncharacterized protein n=1 Tax=Papaver somniferum TaxID=3469 RepID=A0A4Y7J5K4_PAPSO|nr:hypothetical protein C5167_014966 [Papaver somniferum]
MIDSFDKINSNFVVLQFFQFKLVVYQQSIVNLKTPMKSAVIFKDGNEVDKVAEKLNGLRSLQVLLMMEMFFQLLKGLVGISHQQALAQVTAEASVLEAHTQECKKCVYYLIPYMLPNNDS